MTTRGCVSVFPSLCLSDRYALLIISFLTSHDASHLKMLPSDATWRKTKYEAGFADHIWLQVVYCGLFAGVLPVVYSLFAARDPDFDFSSKVILYAIVGAWCFSIKTNLCMVFCVFSSVHIMATTFPLSEPLHPKFGAGLQPYFLAQNGLFFCHFWPFFGCGCFHGI